MTQPPDGRRLLGSEFPDDDGTADPAVAAALAGFERGAVDYVTALGVVAGARLLVPVVAVLGESEVGDDGLARDKSADMAAVLLTGADGRRALLAFTSTATMQRWDPEARPVPVAARTAALAAVQEDAAALVVDVAGPVAFIVEDAALRAVARAGAAQDSPRGE